MLVLNAAFGEWQAKQLAIKEKRYDKLMNVNIKATSFLIKETIELIRAAGKGANILITSSITA